MKRFLFTLIGILLTVPAWAAVVHLNSGTGVTGKVVEVTADSVKIDVEGVPVTYYKDEIASLEGDDSAASTLGVPSVAGGTMAAKPAQAAPAVDVPAAPVADIPAAPSVDAPVKADNDVPPAPAVVPAEQPAPLAAATPQAAPAVSNLSPEKKEKILKFIEVFGTRDTMKMNFDQILASMPPQDSEKLKGAFNIDEVIQALVPLYDKYFTSEDLDGFIQFYSSTNGKKLVQNIPLIMKESIEVSAKYFEEHMPADMKSANQPAQQK